MLPVTMLNHKKIQCRTTDNYVYRAVRTLYLQLKFLDSASDSVFLRVIA